MICLGIDHGQKRVGVALGQGELAIPLTTINREDAITVISELASEKVAARIYVGKPTSLSGVDTKSTSDAVSFALELQKATSIPVFLLDERLTSAQSLKNLRQTGHTARSAKHAVDAEAARLIVELAIACNHSCGESLKQDA